MASDHITLTDTNTGGQLDVPCFRISELVEHNCNVGKGYEVVLAGGTVFNVSRKNYKEVKDFLDSKSRMLEIERRIRYVYTDD